MLEIKGRNNKRIERKTLRKKVWKTIVLSFAILISILSIVAGFESKASVNRMEKIVKKQYAINDTIDENKKVGKKQCKEITSIALINVGDNDSQKIESKDIQNIILVTLIDKGYKGVVHITAIQREAYCEINKNKKLIKIKDTFDRNNPKRFYDTLKSFVDYDVEGFFVYNNDTLKRIMDIQYLTGVSIWELELSMNDKIDLFSKRYDKKSEKVRTTGYQYLDEIQTLAFANVMSEAWGKGWNDVCQIKVLYSILNQLKTGSMADMDAIGKIIMEGDHEISEKELVLIGAAIRSYKIEAPYRWPAFEKYLSFNKQEFFVPDGLIKCAKQLHKKQYKERNYKPSKELIANAKRLKKIDRFMNEYNRKQAEKKALEREKENTNNSSESDDAIYNNNSNSNNPSNNKTRKSKNNNNNRNNNKSESTEPDPTPTPQPSPEPEPTVEPEPQPQPEENNASDSVEQ